MNTCFSLAVLLVFQAAVPGILCRPDISRDGGFDSKYGAGEPHPHIVGGHEVVPHSHPYQVGILLKENIDEGFCGGSLLSDAWVLTAAHCTDFSYILSVGVVVGAHKIRESEDSAQILPIEQVHQHKEYDKAKMTNDISLIRLGFPARYTEYVQPIRLPSLAQKSWSFWNSQVTLTGWGYTTDTDKAVSPILRGVDSRIVSNFYCSLRYYFQMVSGSNICASGWKTKGTCNGDSGGPMALTEKDGKPTLIGVSSFGSGSGCESSYPVVFTRTTSYLDWIYNITELPPRE